MRAATVSEADPLRARGLTCTFRGGKGVFDVSLKLSAGEVLGLMGPNGSGKTTTGRISWFGNSNPRDPSVRRRLGIMLDQPAHFEQMTGYQNAWCLARQF